MNRERKLPFDPKAFLSKVNAGLRQPSRPWLSVRLAH